MAIGLLHQKVLPGPDDGDANTVSPSDWNQDHTITMATGLLLGRTTASAGAVEEIAAGTGLTLSALALSVNWASPGAGLGTTSPQQVDWLSTSFGWQNSTNTTGPVSTLRKSRGSRASPTAVALGDDLGTVRWAGYVGSTNTYKTGAELRVYAAGSPTDTGSGTLPTIIGLSVDNAGTLHEAFQITRNSVSIDGPDAVATNESGATVSFSGGQGNGTGSGGGVTFSGGFGSGTGTGGSFVMSAGQSNALGGSAFVAAGAGGTGDGSVHLQDGYSNTVIEITSVSEVPRLGFFGSTPVERQTYGAPTGTATRTTFATGSVTLPQLAERVKALIDDFRSRGDFA